MNMVFGLLGILVLIGILVAVGFGIYTLIKKLISANVRADTKPTSKTKKPSMKAIEDTLLMRVILAVVLVLVSLVPLGLVSDLVTERSHLYQSVSDRMTNEWSGKQRIAGPILTVPFEYTDTVLDKVENMNTGEVRHVKKTILVTKNLHILPEKLAIKTSLETQELKRGIYTVPIYESAHKINGYFEWPDTSILSNKPEKLLWDKAFVTFLITSPKGIQAGTQFKWNKVAVDLSSGTGFDHSKMQGVHARLKLSEAFKKGKNNFQFTLNLRGSQGVDYAPTGRNSTIQIDADWSDPSFIGAMLPVDREITDTSFSAKWAVPHLSRSYGQLSATAKENSARHLHTINNFAFGVDLFQSVGLYSVLERTVKYGVMFVALTFFSVFVSEFASKTRFHWVQHLMIGAALSMFYLCILAFSEHIDFGYAYAIGVALIAALLGVYSAIVIGKWHYGAGIAGMMVGLYTVLYSILQMEDYALLIGTLLLLIFLMIGMGVTRKLNRT